MFNVNTDWNAVGNIAGMVADSCQGVVTLAWCMIAFTAMLTAVAFIATWDVTHFIFKGVFTLDKELRHTRMEIYANNMLQNWKDRSDFFHATIEKGINAAKAVFKGIIGMFVFTMYLIALVTFAVVAIVPAAVIGVTWMGWKVVKATGSLIRKGADKCKSTWESFKGFFAKKEVKEDEQWVRDVEEELEEEVVAPKRGHFLQRAVAWLLATHREELIKGLKEANLEHKWVTENYGTLHDLEESIDAEPVSEPVEEESQAKAFMMKEFWDAIIERKLFDTIEQMEWNELRSEYAKLRKLVDEPLPSRPKKPQVIELFREHYSAWRASEAA